MRPITVRSGKGGRLVPRLAGAALLSLLLCPAASLPAMAGEAFQTDWSGGPGVNGPVLELGTQFRLDTDAVWEVQGEVTLWPSDEHVVYDDCYHAQEALCCDIDGDGDLDILAAATYDHRIVWCENLDGTGTDWAVHQVVGDLQFCRAVNAADMDGDGDQDVMGAAPYEDIVAWWENEGSGQFSRRHLVDGTRSGVRSLFPMDMDLDGHTDMVGCVYFTGGLVWWENPGDIGAYWVPHEVSTELDHPWSCCSSDLDGDGDGDLLVAERSGDRTVWFENMDGFGGSWSTAGVIDPFFEYSCSVDATDMDGDGDPDVLGAASDERVICWWENELDGGRAWTRHTVQAGYYGACRALGRDMDGDGDPDVVGCAMYSDDVSWWENLDGRGTAWERHIVDGKADYVYDVDVADVDSDGAPDVIGAVLYDDLVSWWDVGSYSSVGYLESSILDTSCTPAWAAIDWSCSEPAGTSLCMQYKTSFDYKHMGEWSEPMVSPGVLPGQLERYVQYRAVLSTSDGEVTPLLQDVALRWDEVRIGETARSTTGSPLSLAITPNPALGAPSAAFGLCTSGTVSLCVYDLSGRVVERIREEHPAGGNRVQLGELPPGVYTCVLSTGSGTRSARFVLIE